MSRINIPNDYPIKITLPDIEPYASGNTGIPFVWRFHGAAPGPNVMVTFANSGRGLMAPASMRKAGPEPILDLKSNF